ncbi:MAG: cobalt ECF transporter T component CbiQ [Deltaproteobacteria bacterium]|nr:cobalt ECF transporter T component CbiQ [Deltaproteobacteria bacterium]
MFSETFSDIYAKRDNLLTRMDARVKATLALAFLAANILTGTVLSLLFFFINVSTLLFLRIPPRTVFIRLLEPFGVAGMVIAIKVFFGGWGAITDAVTIASRVLGAVSIVLLLSMTTPLDDLLKAMSWFKVPRTWTDVALLTYRYIFVLIEDAFVVYSAQRVRLGYFGLRQSLESFGTLTGTIVIRAYDQAIATSQAMRLRGYAG